MTDLISIVVPCYNEESALPHFINEMKRIRKVMAEQCFEIIFVDDGSKDQTLDYIKKMALEDECVKYLSFSRNFGKEAAILAGLEHAKGDYVALLDADLQDPPALLPEMYRIVTKEGYDSAATRRVTRKGEPPIRSFFARIFYKVINAMTEVEIVDGARDFRFMSRKYVNALLALQEHNRFSKGLFGWVGFKTKWIEFENVERVAGETKWSFWKLFKYSIEGIVAFTTTPLLVSVAAGILFCMLAILLVVLLLAKWSMFNYLTATGIGLTAVILFVSGTQALLLGVFGQYMEKMYLEIKKRPIYILDENNIKQEEK